MNIENNKPNPVSHPAKDALPCLSTHPVVAQILANTTDSDEELPWAKA